MNDNIRKIYLFFIILYALLITFAIVAFVFMPNPMPNPEGNFITPGNVQIEWIYAILMAGLCGTITGLISIFFISPGFIKLYVKILSKKQKVGFVNIEKLSGSLLFRKIWIRSFILGFFVGNICFTLAGQEIIIEFMRSVNPTMIYSIPDVETMWQLAWVITIPCTLIVVPMWIMIDSGLVAAKKIKGAQFETVNLASGPLYKVIKGYAGIGFIYNLIIMIIFWVTPVIQRGIFEMAVIIQIISPLIAAGSAFPGVIILEYYKPFIRKRVEKTLIKLGMNMDLAYSIELKDRAFK
ncbi:MAG: hypothetical protein ACFFDF_24160 [Candidatus Odinarchaeota archaeon]